MKPNKIIDNPNNRSLFVCNTYMQLITAIQIKRTLFLEEKADLLLSDHSVGANKRAEQLGKIGLFDKVKFVQTRYSKFKQGKIKDIQDVITLSLGWNDQYTRKLDNVIYTRIFFFNYDFLVYAAFEKSVRAGYMPQLCRMEEGIFSYKHMIRSEMDENIKRLSLIHKARKILGKPCLDENIHDYYVFFKEYFPVTKENVHETPKMSRNDGKLIDMLNAVFDYNPSDDEYPKYVFFGSSRDIDGYKTDETEIVLKLAGILGKDNMLVKMHPRDSRTLYESADIKVSRRSDIPWEIIQLNHDFQGKVFITISSGSFVNSCAVTGDQITAYILYPMESEMDVKYRDFCARNIRETLEILKENGFCEKIKIIDSLDSIS